MVALCGQNKANYRSKAFAARPRLALGADERAVTVDIEGELLLLEDAPKVSKDRRHDAEAEACFLRALELSRKQRENRWSFAQP
jgi:hypothetical protein